MIILKIKSTHCKFALSVALLLSSLLIVNSCAVTQCGVLKLQKAANPEIAVSNNRCTGSDMALESIVYIQAHSSVEFVTSVDEPVASGHQIICRNQSQFPLKIRVDSAASPWIRPVQNLIHCNDWLNGRLVCSEAWSDEKTLVCTISERENEYSSRYKSKETSPEMRGLQSDDADIDNVALRMYKESIYVLLKKDIRPQIDQCRKDYPSDQVLTLAWTIKSNGTVIDPGISENISEDGFAKCAIEVIKKYPFPSPPIPNDIPVTHEF